MKFTNIKIGKLEPFVQNNQAFFNMWSTLRHKEQHEVDILVTQNSKPWMLVEVKSGDAKMSKDLIYFKQQLQVRYVLQLNFAKNFIATNIFDLNGPKIVPAKTMLSQLL